MSLWHFFFLSTFLQTVQSIKQREGKSEGAEGGARRPNAAAARACSRRHREGGQSRGETQ